MAGTVDTYALTSLDMVKQYLGLSSNELTGRAMTIYRDSSDSATAALLTVTPTAITTTVTGGTEGGNSTTFAAATTMGAMVTALVTVNDGWIIERLCHTSVATTDLLSHALINSYLVANKQTLLYTNNFLLAELINMASDRVEKICNRKFMSQTVRERVYPEPGRKVILKNYPIIDVREVSVGRRDAIRVQCTASDAVAALVRVSESGGDVDLQIVGGASAGTTNLTFSSYATITLLSAAITATSGWSSEVMGSLGAAPTLDLIDTPGLYCLNQNAYIELPDKQHADYQIVDVNNGMLKVSGTGNAEVFVRYTGGYATVPDDLQQIVLEIIKETMDAKSRDTSLKSETLGDYSWEGREVSVSNAVRQKLYGWMSEPF